MYQDKKREMKQISNQLLVTYLQQKCTTQEVLIVETWIQENQQEFIAFKKAWETAMLANELDKIDTHKAWKKIQPKTKPSFQLKYIFGAVAAIALFFYLAYNPNNISFPFFNSNQLTYIAQTDTDSYVLPDGSKVWLYKGSVLTYPKKFKKDNRNIHLTGQAYFKVTKNPHKPFHVHLKNTKTTVLGTEFNLNGLKENIELVLSEGRVQFTSPIQTMYLKPNEKITCNTLGHLSKKTNIDANYNAWKTKILTFKNTPLPKVIKDINNVYHTHIKVDENTLKNEALTIEFKQEKLDAVLNTLSILYHLKISYPTKNQILLSSF